MASCERGSSYENFDLVYLFILDLRIDQSGIRTKKLQMRTIDDPVVQTN